MPGANGQEKTKEELIISLKEAATDILELHRQEARNEAVSQFQAVTQFEEIPLFI